jgi:hypothetical protein
LLVLGLTVFTLLAIRSRQEEANLVARFGDAYRHYQTSTGAFFPRLRFSLRVLCVVLLAIAVCFALLGNRIRQAEHQWMFLSQIERLEGDVWYADERSPDGWTRTENPDVDREGLQARLYNACFRSFDRVSILADDVPAELFDDVATWSELRELIVSPPVARGAAVQRLKQSRPDIDVHVHWAPRHVPFQEMNSPEELQGAIQAPHVLLFIDGFWSVDCAVFRPIAAAIPEAWNAKSNRPSVAWLRIDLSDVNSKVTQEFWQWLGERGLPLGGLKQQGAGLVVWFEDGHVKSADWCFRFSDVDSLMARTLAQFDGSTLASESNSD